MRLITLLIAMLLISGCTVSIDGKKYKELTPSFNLHRFFEGEVKAWGIVQDRKGNLIQRFQVDITGSVIGGNLILDETFSYGFGEGPKKRTWTITSPKPGVYKGSANDINGPASGQDYGNAMFWGYKMDLPVGDTTYSVKFEDWMWAFDENTIVNRSYIKKFGITFAEVTIFMQKPLLNSHAKPHIQENDQ